MKKEIKVSDSELEVLKIIWKKKMANSLEIIEELKKDFEWNESTIRTLLLRLLNKGAIDIAKKEGRIFIYKALVDENKFKLKESKSFISKIYNGSIQEMLLNFVEEKSLSKEDIKKLMDLIEKEG